MNGRTVLAYYKSLSLNNHVFYIMLLEYKADSHDKIIFILMTTLIVIWIIVIFRRYFFKKKYEVWTNLWEAFKSYNCIIVICIIVIFKHYFLRKKIRKYESIYDVHTNHTNHTIVAVFHITIELNCLTEIGYLNW